MAQNPSSSSRSKAKSSTRKSPAKPAAKSTRKPAARSAAKPAARSAAKPASRSAAKPASRSAAKPAAKSAGSTRSAASRKAAASKGGKARARQQKATKAASSTAKTAAKGARSAGVEAKTVAELRDALRKNLIRPMEIVMISRERIEEVLGEAVDQGRVTVRDAQRISAGLVKRGQRQTSDVLKDLENLLDRGRGEVESRTSTARTRAVRSASPALAQVDRVRRTAKVGPAFPVTGYDDLTAAQIQGRLGTLTPAELRKVRDHERRNANRKTVLQSIESKLG